MNHSQLIQTMVSMGIPVSPFMNYWTLSELLRYYKDHMK